MSEELNIEPQNENGVERYNQAVYNTANFKSFKGEHPKFTDTIVMMLSSNLLPYYAEFATAMNFYRTNSIPTCGVNVSSKGMNFYWNNKFVDSLTKPESLFLLIHEECHLLFDHTKRAIHYNKQLSNVVQDMIINQIIHDDILKKINTSTNIFIDIPKHHDEFIKNENGDDILDEQGNPIPNPNYNHNSVLFIPDDYPGQPIFEELYEWTVNKQYDYKKRLESLKNNKPSDSNGGNQPQNGGNQPQSGGNDSQKGKGGKKGKKQDGNGDGQSDGNGDSNENNQSNSGDGKKDSFGKPVYGKYGKNGVECASLDSLFDSMESGNNQLTLDSHISDDVQENQRKTIVSDIMQKLKNRGLQSGDIEAILNKLRKSKTNYLKEIKRTMSNHVFGTSNKKSITKPNRREIEGIKGKKKYKNIINCILDTSGSMGGDFEHVLSYIFQNEIHINLIQIDTTVKTVELIKNKRELLKMKINGLGGTELQPAINYIKTPKNKLHSFNNVILTDGYTDHLDFSEIKGKTLILTTAISPKFEDPYNRVKVIQIDKNESIYN